LFWFAGVLLSRFAERALTDQVRRRGAGSAAAAHAASLGAW
jgi:hypothetical protein